MHGQAESQEGLFAGRHFDREIIILCVRWYLRYKLSLRDLVEMMSDSGLHLSHTTIMRRVQRYVPEFEKCWARYGRRSGRSWRVDETYVKVRGRWTYLYPPWTAKVNSSAKHFGHRDGHQSLSRLMAMLRPTEQRVRCLTRTRRGRGPDCDPRNT